MPNDPAYLQAIQLTAAMANDPQAQRLAAAYGLNIVNVMWEDTGRYKDSSVGPNISDVTIQVMNQRPGDGRIPAEPHAGHPLPQFFRPDRRYLPGPLLPAGRQ